MKFSEYLKIFESYDLISYTPIGLVIFSSLTFMFYEDSISILYGVLSLCLLWRIIICLPLRYKSFKNISYPTFEIYQKIKDNRDQIEIYDDKAVFRVGSSDPYELVYSRSFPGGFSSEIEELDYFSLDETRILEHQFREAIKDHDIEKGSKAGLSKEHKENRAKLAKRFSIEE